MAVNGMQAPVTSWNTSLVPNYSGASTPNGHFPAGQYGDAMFEQNLDSVLTPRFESSVGIPSTYDPPLTTRTAAQVRSYSRVDLEEELMRVQLQRDDLRDRLLREREVKAIEAKQWRKRALHAQELLISERRSNSALQETVRALEQQLASQGGSALSVVETPRTFAVENGIVLSESTNHYLTNGSIKSAAALSLAAHGDGRLPVRSPPPQTSVSQTPSTPRAQTPRAQTPVSAHNSPNKPSASSAAPVPPLTPGKVASLIGNFNPPLEGSGTRAPASSAQSTPNKVRAQSEPAAPQHTSTPQTSSMLSHTGSRSKAFAYERLVRIPRGEGGGVGLRFGVTKEGKVFVTEVMSGATADRFGQLRVGDEILEVNGAPVAKRVLQGLRTGSDGVAELSGMIRGDHGSILAIKLKTLTLAAASPRAFTPGPHPAAAQPRPSPRQPEGSRSARTLFPAAPPGQGGAGEEAQSSASALGYWKRKEAEAAAGQATAPPPAPYWQLSPPKPASSTPAPADNAAFRFLF